MQDSWGNQCTRSEVCWSWEKHAACAVSGALKEEKTTSSFCHINEVCGVLYPSRSPQWPRTALLTEHSAGASPGAQVKARSRRMNWNFSYTVRKSLYAAIQGQKLDLGITCEPSCLQLHNLTKEKARCSGYLPQRGLVRNSSSKHHSSSQSLIPNELLNWAEISLNWAVCIYNSVAHVLLTLLW